MRLNNNYNICCGRLYRVSGFPAASGLSYFQVGGLTASRTMPPLCPPLRNTQRSLRLKDYSRPIGSAVW